jgi:hypothetical protein
VADLGEWQFDARQEDPLTALRIPCTGPSPEWCYLVALATEDVMAADVVPRPTDAEAAMIASLIDYRRSEFGPTWQAKLLARPLDVDGGHVTTVLRKRGDEDWTYRLTTWTSGWFWWPPPAWHDAHRKLSLLGLLNYIATCGDVIMSPGWDAWKAAHPDAFPLNSKENTGA